MFFATDLIGTRGNTLYSSVKLRHVSIWSTPVMGSSPTAQMVTCGLEWQGLRGPATLISDTGNAFSPAHVSSKPPKDSEAQFWSQVASSTTVRYEVLFYITCPKESIVDVTVSYVEANGLQGASPTETLIISNIIGTPPPDAFCANHLDCETITGTPGGFNLVPVELFATRGN